MRSWVDPLVAANTHSSTEGHAIGPVDVTVGIVPVVADHVAPASWVSTTTGWVKLPGVDPTIKHVVAEGQAIPVGKVIPEIGADIVQPFPAKVPSSTPLDVWATSKHALDDVQVMSVTEIPP